MSYLPRMTNSLAEAIDAELGRARQKFPSNDRLLGALMEEVGELARALLEHGSGSPEVRDEGIQAAAMVIRLITEGDPAYPPKSEESGE